MASNVRVILVADGGRSRRVLVDALAQRPERWELVAAAKLVDPPGAGDCVVAFHDPPTSDVLGLLSDRDKAGLWSTPVVVVTGDIAAHRELYRAGATACVEMQALAPGALARAVEDAQTRTEARQGAGTLEAEIAERRRIEASLRDSEERFGRLANAMPQLVWTALGDGTVTYYNSRATQYDGLRRLGDDHWAWQPVVHPDDAEGTMRAWQTAVRTGETYEYEHRLRMADGSFRWHLSRAFGESGPDGALRWYGTATDVHELKLAQEALRDADRRKDEFLAMLGHELRNPLAAIRHAADLVQLAHGEPAILQRAHAVLDRQSSHITRLIDGLLDVTRIRRGILELDRRRTDLVSIVRDVVSDLERDAEQRTLALRGEFGSEPLPLDADVARLTQVFTNLVGNAVKFTPAGGTITVTVTPDADSAVVSVRDTGVGFGPETRAILFEPFQQGPQDIARQSGGLGLGLALVRTLVELHGGSVEARSDGSGSGAEFEVRLPLASR